MSAAPRLTAAAIAAKYFLPFRASTTAAASVRIHIRNPTPENIIAIPVANAIVTGKSGTRE